MFKRKKKKCCKAEEGTKNLRQGHKNFLNSLKEIRQSSIDEQTKNGEWMKSIPKAKIASS